MQDTLLIGESLIGEGPSGMYQPCVVEVPTLLCGIWRRQLAQAPVQQQWPWEDWHVTIHGQLPFPSMLIYGTTTPRMHNSHCSTIHPIRGTKNFGSVQMWQASAPSKGAPTHCAHETCAPLCCQRWRWCHLYRHWQSLPCPLKDNWHLEFVRGIRKNKRHDQVLKHEKWEHEHKLPLVTFAMAHKLYTLQRPSLLNILEQDK